MTEVTTVYICTRQDHPFQMLGPELIPLSRSFRERKNEASTDFIQAYLGCPAVTDMMKDTFVVNSPVDMNFDTTEEGDVRVSSTGWESNASLFWDKTVLTSGNSKYSVQVLLDYYICLYADKPTILEFTPPYMHRSNLYGFSGRYDIHNWLRPLGFVIDTHECTSIKAGEPLGYLRFLTNNRIKLVYVDTNEEFFYIAKACTNYKGIKASRPLSYLYSLFNSSRQKAKLLKLLKELEND